MTTKRVVGRAGVTVSENGSVMGAVKGEWGGKRENRDGERAAVLPGRMTMTTAAAATFVIIARFSVRRAPCAS